jgi:hypothetical protein
MGLLQCRPVINTANIQLPAGWPFIDKNQRPAVLTPDTSGVPDFSRRNDPRRVIMNKRLSVVLLSVLLAMSAGCSNKKAQEMDTRIDAAQSTANAAQSRADAAYSRADQAAAAASQAQRTADEANERASRMLEKASRK